MPVMVEIARPLVPINANGNSEQPVIAVEPEMCRFRFDDPAAGEQHLARLLSRQRDTQPLPIRVPSRAQLDSLGRVCSEYRYTTVALYRLCSLLAPGLGPLVLNLAGQSRRELNGQGETYSLQRAIRILNAVINDRAGLLSGHQFILDRRTGRIEGIVGPRYHFVSNLEVYQRVSDFIRHSGISSRFHEGALVGRRLQLRYRCNLSAFSSAVRPDKLEPFYGGWHWVNSELGETSVRGSCLLYDEAGNLSALASYDRRSLVRHVARGFEDRLRDCLQHVFDRMLRVQNLREAMSRLGRTRLGWGGTQEQHHKRYRELSTLLRKLGYVQIRDGVHDCLDRAARRGETAVAFPRHAGRDASVPVAAEALQALRSRTAYDLYLSVLECARQFPVHYQELVEQAAYRLLVDGAVRL